MEVEYWRNSFESLFECYTSLSRGKITSSLTKIILKSYLFGFFWIFNYYVDSFKHDEENYVLELSFEC